MKVEFEGKKYDFDLEDIDVREAIYLQEFTGMTIVDLWNGFRVSDPKALVALYWLMQKQNGVTMDIHGINFKALKFDAALTAAYNAEAEAKAAANPTEKSPEPQGASASEEVGSPQS